MMTSLEAAVSRKVALTSLFSQLKLEGPFAGQALFELFDRVALFDPIERRFTLALPDYSTTR